MIKWAVSSTVFFFVFILISSPGIAERASNGAAMYKKHCSACHPNAAKMSGVRIVEIMRYPPPAMPTFDNDKISDRDADVISHYIRLQISEKSSCKALYEETCSKNL
jgi:mono/diheme cytochrome c family protein